MQTINFVMNRPYQSLNNKKHSKEIIKDVYKFYLNNTERIY